MESFVLVHVWYLMHPWFFSPGCEKEITNFDKKSHLNQTSSFGVQSVKFLGCLFCFSVPILLLMTFLPMNQLCCFWSFAIFFAGVMYICHVLPAEWSRPCWGVSNQLGVRVSAQYENLYIPDSSGYPNGVLSKEKVYIPVTWYTLSKKNYQVALIEYRNSLKDFFGWNQISGQMKWYFTFT